MTESNQLDAATAAQICQLIGCSGLSPDMCRDRPQICSITRNFADTYGKWLDDLDRRRKSKGG